MSTPPKMKPAKGKVNHKGNQKTKRAKRDDDVMNTNDSSIVSKRCVSKLYFSEEPDFYEPFVPKFVRRNPLINRGYWLRMHAIEQVVRRFLEEENNKKKIVVNLGCGYDPLPFQFWHRYESLTKSAIFVDVDYPQLIEKKRDRMLTNALLRDGLLKTKLQPSALPVYLRSEQYMAIGCDLRDLEVLERTLRAEVDMSSSSVLYVAEVSATYMPVADSDRLLGWAATSFDDARFCILEQYLPQGPDHPFAKTMLAHFKKLQASIYAVERYLTLEQQSSRFLDAGWTKLDIARNLWDLWSDDTFTSPALRQKLDTIESFDEWEEYGCYAGHYFLLVASNVGSKNSVRPSGLHSANPDAGNITGVAEVLHINASAIEAEVRLTPRRFTAAFVLDDHSIAVYGGQGSQSRLSDVDILRREDQPSSIQPCTSPPPYARMCHTVTSINDKKSLLVGGRGSPTQAFGDCWLIDDGAWTRVDDMATARYRHSAVSLDAGHGDKESKAVLVFGGKARDGSVLDDWIMWAEKDGWRSIPVDGPHPSARFGAAISTIGLNDGVGLLIGGVDAGGTVVEDVWEWTFCATPTPRLIFRNRTNDVHSALTIAEYARIGASMVPWGDDSLLLIGGVSRDGIHGLSEDFVLLTHSDTRIDVRYPAVQLPSTWPLLVGAGIVAVSRDEIVIAGGGAVCFSMGSFWNQGCLTVTKAGMQGAWRAVPAQVSGTAVMSLTTTPKAPQLGASSKKPTKRAPRSVTVPRVTLQTPEDFAKLFQASKPAIIEGQSLGPCVDLWTTGYLKERIGPDHELVVHECSSDRMTFKDKNFAYVKKTTTAFLDGIENGSPEYLRAVSSTQPNKLPTRLEDDFPSIAADFHIPELFEVVKANSHSSPLRISGPVSLWLHYDVLSNILCQIRGTKTLHLFPPSDVRYLSYPPGGSSSNTDIHTSKDPKLRFTHPHIASLKPSDILFIPPMWSHTATPQDGISVAVNVFWRDLEKGYAAGKDVYGNRDLQAYENGRRDVEKIVRAFKDVPADISRFYLDRLAGEIQDSSDKVAEKARKKTT